MKFERKGWLLIVVRYVFSVRDIELFAKSARAQPEVVAKVELRRVATARVRHWKEKSDEVEKYCRSSERNERDKRASRCRTTLLIACLSKEEILPRSPDVAKTSVCDDVRKIRANFTSTSTFSPSRKLSKSLQIRFASRMLRMFQYNLLFFPSVFLSILKKNRFTTVCTRECNFVASNYPKDPITWTVDGRFIVSYVKRLTWTDHENRKCIGRVAYTDTGVGWTLLWESVPARVPLSRMWSILCDNLETSITQINTRGNFNKPYRKRRWNKVSTWTIYLPTCVLCVGRWFDFSEKVQFLDFL